MKAGVRFQYPTGGAFMFETILPQKLRRGFTLRRLKKAFRAPSILVRNLRFWWEDEVSPERHIFVMGPPRSGTTLVKNVLRAHSDICSVDGETYFFYRRNYAAFRHDAVPDERMKSLIAQATSDIDLFDRFAEEIRQRSDGDIFLEKTPEHALRLAYLTSHYPNAPFVFVVRDPRDGFRSAKENPRYWDSLPDAHPLQAYAETWCRSVRAYLDLCDYSQVFLVRYEKFCRDAESKLKSINYFLGLDTQKQQLDPSSYGQTDVSHSTGHQRLRKPITTDTIGRWRDALSEKEVDEIEHVAAEEMEELGYDPQNRQST